ncbi:hypothetical protein [Nostoc sp.]
MFQKLFGKGKRLRYLCQDQTRLGLKTETGKLITAFGVKPVAPVLWKRDNFWLYGVVEPLSGWHFCKEYTHLDRGSWLNLHYLPNIRIIELNL